MVSTTDGTVRLSNLRACEPFATQRDAGDAALATPTAKRGPALAAELRPRCLTRQGSAPFVPRTCPQALRLEAVCSRKPLDGVISAIRPCSMIVDPLRAKEVV